MRKIIMAISLGLSFLLISTITFSQTTISPSDPNIVVMGRVLVVENENLQFDWPAVTISANFSGPSCSIKMDDTNRNYYNVFIDGIQEKVIEVHSDTTLILASELEDAPHSLMLTKRTEGEQGKATFKGFILASDQKLLPPTLRQGPKIEFIGNSITCGYGAESEHKEDHFKPETENSYYSYASIIARAFDADFKIIAHSGMGVVRNYGYKEQTSPHTMADRYKQLFDEEKMPLWDFSTWIPDMVVINLGTNDFSTKPHPNETIFNKRYNELIRFIRSNYQNVPIFCLVGPMTDEPCYTIVKNMVNGNRNYLKDPNIYFIGIPQYLMNPDTDLGAGWHPNYAGQTKMAAHIIPVITSVTGFEKTK